MLFMVVIVACDFRSLSCFSFTRFFFLLCLSSLLFFFFFFLMIRRPPRSPLFPYPPLFRSEATSRRTSCRPPRRPAGSSSRASSSLTRRSRSRSSLCQRWRRACRPKSRADRKSTRLNSSHLVISYAVFCLKKKKKTVFESDVGFSLDMYGCILLVDDRRVACWSTGFVKRSSFSLGQTPACVVCAVAGAPVL